MDIAPIEKRQILREHLWEILHNGKGWLGHAFNFLLVVLILLSAAIVVVKFLPAYPAYDTFTTIIEAIIVGIFTVEYLLRIYAAPSRLRYIFSFLGLVDLLSIAPFYTGIFHTDAIRILRLIRFFKLGDIRSSGQNEEDINLGQGVGLVEGERMEHIVSKHPLFLIIGCIAPLVSFCFGFSILLLTNGDPIGISMGVALMLFALILLWKTWLDFSYDAIYITNYRLIFNNQHLLGRSVNQMNYSAITNVKPSYPSVMSYIFRYGTLTIDTAAEPGEISINMVRHHEKAARLIMQKCFPIEKANV